MKQYIFNKDQFEFYTSNGSCVQAWQVEQGKVWTLEVFPPNQTTESFESCQYNGSIEMSTNGTKSDWCIKEYPETWTSEDKEEYKTEMQNQLGMVELRDILEYCDHCRTQVDTEDEPVYELEDGRIYCEECYIQKLAEQKGLVK